MDTGPELKACRRMNEQPGPIYRVRHGQLVKVKNYFVFSPLMRKVIIYFIRSFFVGMVILLCIGFVTININDPGRFAKKGIFDCLALLLFVSLCILSFKKLKTSK